ncbi:hypothetical protein [Lutibacter sp. B1]|uniref:hypothetical protein n=1 Tax=Lutibacter sp. B1 TaxID=2725996 RepID=UPI00145743FE|nr:hypothetical protein [Lutibacter sp. B1]NLP58448.1 hypothetical protein [Lutibacter sp. B1]
MVTTILLPFAVQFIHSFEKHEHSICTSQNVTHFDNHEIDCSVFHFKINHNTIDFTSQVLFTQIKTVEEKIYNTEAKSTSVKLNYKSSRAPPYFIV